MGQPSVFPHGVTVYDPKKMLEWVYDRTVDQ